MPIFIRLIYLISSLLLLSCESYIGVKTAPEKTAKYELSQSREQAVDLFWEIFLAGQYEHIAKALTPLKAAYLANPNDPELALYIAHLHLWRISERFRLNATVDPNITDDLTVAIKYFTEAKKLSPDDHRIDGWLAGARIAQADVHNDEKNKISAYFDGLDAIKRYPEFNYFSIGYLLSNAAPTNKHYQDAIEGYFKSMDIAYHSRIDRQQPTIAPYLGLQDKEQNQRLKLAVWNSLKAPHNVEGYYLNFGDFLVKSGQLKLAKIIYQNAQLTDSYDSWPFAYILEERLNNLATNTIAFRTSFSPRSFENLHHSVHKRMIFNSYNCMICHQSE